MFCFFVRFFANFRTNWQMKPCKKTRVRFQQNTLRAVIWPFVRLCLSFCPRYVIFLSVSSCFERNFRTKRQAAAYLFVQKKIPVTYCTWNRRNDQYMVVEKIESVYLSRSSGFFVSGFHFFVQVLSGHPQKCPELSVFLSAESDSFVRRFPLICPEVRVFYIY